MTDESDPNEINEWLDCEIPVDFTIEGRVIKRCPVKDEEDAGSIEIFYLTATRLPELHELARLLEFYDEGASSHEDYTALMCKITRADRVTTKWRTAGLWVTCTVTGRPDPE